MALASSLLLLSLSSCADKPTLVVSGDLSCERFRHISATDEQRGLIEKYWSIMESWARQVAGHNIEYDKDCLNPPKADPKGKSK